MSFLLILAQAVPDADAITEKLSGENGVVYGAVVVIIVLAGVVAKLWHTITVKEVRIGEAYASGKADLKIAKAEWKKDKRKLQKQVKVEDKRKEFWRGKAIERLAFANLLESRMRDRKLEIPVIQSDKTQAELMLINEADPDMEVSDDELEPDDDDDE